MLHMKDRPPSSLNRKNVRMCCQISGGKLGNVAAVAQLPAPATAPAPVATKLLRAVAATPDASIALTAPTTLAAQCNSL